MKKNLLLGLLLFVCSFALSAKSKINMDKISGRVRVIQTEHTAHIFPYAKTLTDCGISLTCIQDTNTQETNWEIRVYIYSADADIAQGNKLLLKLKNDEIITLSANDNYSPEIMRRTTNVFGAILNDTYVVAPCYPISKADLDKIMTSDVTKVRVETYDDQFDGNVYGTKFSKTIKNNYILITSVLEKKKTIYDDF